ncbi:snare-like protein [Wallemia mellicola]|uniref:Coatomer subunit delta n=2 Tax=Wallemia mellicola TaxID=1708541 RepID=A0A4T0QKG2_9BASI|nr:snare-like protein [Wallemia mellicola CBS 633.66]TIB71644.1 hypothetical protein E3Q24_02159 [Wallemia mellicola]EIM21997.1 snare-like protein [Wallemia mellicola CBS 633.66]TIB79228.1 hypothetical protein E3Q23_00383 [Wallemia mellicola]TIB81188.1 snare-like protein [Wallemia mellicola]TIB84322.1 snare-like protein [Wallemia mellicola]|eukprot:XP_006957806.1 snare-like protein [Wallemia mellicola CBS 633.66]
MTILSAAICTKSGTPLISRQYKQLTRTRVEGLLNTFPKLIPTNSQNTTVETEAIRFLYQPINDLYLVLITNKGSNILQDIETLNLFNRITIDIIKQFDQEIILNHAFDLLIAWDEIIELGYRDNNNFNQIKLLLEMDSHEEKIQEIIAKNKEMEAKEELKRRARQLELQRREAARVGQSTGLSMGKYSSSSEINMSSTPSIEQTSPIQQQQPSQSRSQSHSFKGTGMKLGGKKKNTLDVTD